VLRPLPAQRSRSSPRKADDDCLQGIAALRPTFGRGDRVDLAAWIAKWEARYPKLVGWVEETIEETRTFYRLPRLHHKRLKSTNMLERLNEEIRPPCCADAEACLRLVRALAVETHENWLEAPFNSAEVDNSKRVSVRSEKVAQRVWDFIAASVRFFAFNFFIMFRTCTLTVLSFALNSYAITLFDLPCRIACTTASSRAVTAPDVDARTQHPLTNLSRAGCPSAHTSPLPEPNTPPGSQFQIPS
jgi:putative transposase